MTRVLIADDDRDVQERPAVAAQKRRLRDGDGDAPGDVVKALTRERYDAALIDLNYTRDTTSGQEGLDLLTQIRGADATLPVVVMTAWGSVELAVEAVRRGAKDFIQKPWDNRRLLSVLRTQIELAQALRRGARLEAENKYLRTEGAAPSPSTNR